MPDATLARRHALLVRVETFVCALPLAGVIETLRPLPVEAVRGAPPFVAGISVVRGLPTPVVNLGALLGRRSERSERWVTLRVADKQVALAIDAVLDVCDLARMRDLRGVPPLLDRVSPEFVASIATLNRDVLAILREALQLPEEIWIASHLQEAQP